MSNELIKKTDLPFAEIMTISKAFAESGMFPDAKSAAQAFVKISAGNEIGVPPFQSMSGIHIIQGRLTIGAGLMASVLKGSGKYDYKASQGADYCEIEVFQSGKSIGKSKFTTEDAKKAGTKNMDKFPQNMLFARAISNAVKWYAPDVFNGPVYTPEEFEQVTEDAPATATTGQPGTGEKPIVTAARELRPLPEASYKRAAARLMEGNLNTLAEARANYIVSDKQVTDFTNLAFEYVQANPDNELARKLIETYPLTNEQKTALGMMPY